MVSRTGSDKLESANAAEVVERTRRLEGAGMRSFVEDPPFVLSAARGALMVDADGREYVDLYATFAVAAVGHQHPAVVEAVRRQADVLMHCSSAHPSPVRAEFYEALIAIAPRGLTRVLPAITGAMANEIAIAIARIRRPGAPVIAFEGSYFGRSVGTVGYAGKAAYRERLGVPASAQFVPYPDSTVVQDASETLEAIERLVGRAGGVGPPAAIILEAVQGNGGVVSSDRRSASWFARPLRSHGRTPDRGRDPGRMWSDGADVGPRAQRCRCRPRVRGQGARWGPGGRRCPRHGRGDVGP